MTASLHPLPPQVTRAILWQSCPEMGDVHWDPRREVAPRQTGHWTHPFPGCVEWGLRLVPAAASHWGLKHFSIFPRDSSNSKTGWKANKKMSECVSRWHTEGRRKFPKNSLSSSDNKMIFLLIFFLTLNVRVFFRELQKCFFSWIFIALILRTTETFPNVQSSIIWNKTKMELNEFVARSRWWYQRGPWEGRLTNKLYGQRAVFLIFARRKH